MDLTGRTVLITGASRGIGRALAQELSRRRLRLLLGVRDLADAPALANARAVELDLSSPAAIDAGLAALDDETVDVLINNAGEFIAGRLEEQDPDAIAELVQVNVLGVMHLTRRLLPGMLARGHGKIVNQGSIVGYLFVPGVTTYAATKAAVRGFTESLARELDGTGVSVLELVTGGVDTDMLAEARAALDDLYATDTDGWIQYSAPEWAQKVVKAIEDDDDVVGPGGKAALGKLATHGPRWLLDRATRRAFDRG
jgi:short-subunit dehydrogenase